jgi:hypothetical protein
MIFTMAYSHLDTMPLSAGTNAQLSVYNNNNNNNNSHHHHHCRRTLALALLLCCSGMDKSGPLYMSIVYN